MPRALELSLRTTTWCRWRSRMVAGVAAIVASVSSTGRADEPLRAVVRVVTAEDRALFGRIEGQITDLPVKLEMDPSEVLETDIAGQLTAADGIAAAHGAGIVVWLEAQQDTLLVFVSEPRTGRVLVRRLHADGPGLSSSAILETAALVVRSALRALAEGGVIGVERRELAPPPPPPAVPRSVPPSSATRRTKVRPTLGLGYTFMLDGLADSGGHAILLSGGIEHRALGLRLELAGGFPTTLPGPYGDIHVSRQTGALVVALRALDTRVVDLDLEGRIGAALFLRDAIDTTPSVTASSSSVNLLASIGAQAALRVRPWARLPWRFAVGAGGGFFLPPLSVGYIVRGQYVEAGVASVFPQLFAAFEWSPESD